MPPRQFDTRRNELSAFRCRAARSFRRNLIANFTKRLRFAEFKVLDEVPTFQQTVMAMQHPKGQKAFVSLASSF